MKNDDVRYFFSAEPRGRPLNVRGVGAAAALLLVLPCVSATVLPAPAQAEVGGVGTAAPAAAPPAAEQQPAAAATPAAPAATPTFRARAERRDERGVGRVTFRTPHGDLVCHLPSELAPGDTVSGTVEARPKGGGQGGDGGAGNAAALAALRVRLGGAEGEPVAAGTGDMSASGGGTRTLYRWRLPREVLGWAAVALHDAAGAEVGRAVATLYSRPAMSPGQFRLPRGAKVGESFAVDGAFDGDAGNTSVRLGERELPVLAESPRRCIVEGPAEALGKTRLAVREGGGGGATATATPAAEGDFAYEKGRRRSNAGPVLVVLGLAVVVAIAVYASSFKDGLGGFGGFGGY